MWPRKLYRCVVWSCNPLHHDHEEIYLCCFGMQLNFSYYTAHAHTWDHQQNDVPCLCQNPAQQIRSRLLCRVVTAMRVHDFLPHLQRSCYGKGACSTLRRTSVHICLIRKSSDNTCTQDELRHWEARYAKALQELQSSNSCNAALLRALLTIKKSQVCIHNPHCHNSLRAMSRNLSKTACLAWRRHSKHRRPWQIRPLVRRRWPIAKPRVSERITHSVPHVRS